VRWHGWASTPILGAERQVLGTLTILNDNAFRPTAQQDGFVAGLIQIAGFGIERAQLDARWRNACTDLVRVVETVASGASLAGALTDRLSGVVINARAALPHADHHSAECRGHARDHSRVCCATTAGASAMITRPASTSIPWRRGQEDLHGSGTPRLISERSSRHRPVR
jgi:hypothetical protein